MLIIDSLNSYPYSLQQIAQKIYSQIPIQEIKELYPDLTHADYLASIILTKYIPDETLFEDIACKKITDAGLYEEFFHEAIKHKILCHHYTRVMDESYIISSGLKSNNWDNYSALMDNIFQAINIDDTMAKEAIRLLHEAYVKKYLSEANDVNYSTRISSKLIEGYTSNLGGELAMNLQQYNEIWSLISTLGIPIRIDFVSDIMEDSKYYSLIHHLLICILSNMIWGVSDEEGYCGIIKNDICKEKIINITRINNCASDIQL